MPIASTYAITGIQAGLDPKQQYQQKPLRQDVDTWWDNRANEKQHDLFFQALTIFQKMPVEEKLSYWQVAGIHGQPLVPWDEDAESLSNGYGYCTHNSILFPDWHRPYILLFEQRLHQIMLDIIKDYPKSLQQDYIDAANAWRMPYWDWAAKKFDESWSRVADYNLPKIVRPKEVVVTRSYGTWIGWVSIPNPMYAFYTSDGKTMGSYGKYSLTTIVDPPDTFHYEECIGTSRCPRPSEAFGQDWVKGVQNNDIAKENLRKHGWYQSGKEKTYTDTLGEAVYRLFTENYFSTYDAFASTRLTNKPAPPPDYLSLEGIHNNVHNWTGGYSGGHMVEPPVAAFDPIFWMHHCNVDRQFAIWQALNPNAWFDDKEQQLSDPDGNWSTPAGTIVTPKTKLAPFHSDAKGTTYTSNSARDYFALGYSYPELQPWKFVVSGKLDVKAYQADIRKQLTSLYASTRNVMLGISAPLVEHSEQTAGPYVKHDDYVVNIRYERFARGGSPFSIHILIGENYHVGSVYNFSAKPLSTGNSEGGCQNCHHQNAEHALQKDQVNITNALVDAINDKEEPLHSLSPEDVEAYLKKNLHWVVKTTKFEDVPLESLPSLRISVAGGKGTHYYDSAKGSRYENYRVMRKITHGRLGGLSNSEEF